MSIILRANSWARAGRACEYDFVPVECFNQAKLENSICCCSLFLNGIVAAAAVGQYYLVVSILLHEQFCCSRSNVLCSTRVLIREWPVFFQVLRIVRVK